MFTRPSDNSLLRQTSLRASILALALLVFFLPNTIFIFAQARCDADKACIGAALTLSQSAQAQYVDVRQSASQSSLTTALTFEAWLNPTRQAGVRQFIAGRWGPNTDQNDVWVVYISAQDELVFEINGATTSLGAMDNTIARTSIANRYNTWFHVAAVFDGATQTARIFVNGVEVAQNRNATQPASILRVPQSAALLLQIGSANALNNVGEQNATFRGQMDEIRLWSRALTQSEIFCGQTSSLEGNTALPNERGLVLYYRCNEAANAVTLCDASNNANTGDLRSGARCLPPTQNRTIPQILSVSPAQFTEAFTCDQSRTYTVQIRNASPSCAEQVSVSVLGQDASQFTVSPRLFTLGAGGTTQATVRLQTNLTGDLQAEITVVRTNRCGDTLRVPVRLTRSTLVQASVRSVTFATLFAGCREIPFLETTFTLRNTASQAITLQSLTNTRSQMFRVLGTSFPQTLQANAATQVTMRFFASDSANIYNDTLRIRTNDACQPELALPVRGTIEEAVVIRRGYGLARLDSVAFGRECPEGGISDPVDFTWESVSSSATVRIDTVIYPAFMRGKSLRYPVLLRPNTFADPNFLRFAPVREGFVRDSVLIRASIPSATANVSGCTFEKKIYVSGRGNAIQTRLTPQSVSFGMITIGQTGLQQPTLTNPSNEDTLRVSVYFRTGSVFALTGARAFTLLPRQTVMIPITFRPVAVGSFTDELCVFEQRCFFTTCATVQGSGVQQTFRIDSAVKRIENVLGCSFRQDSVVIRNLTNTDQLLTNLAFANPTGKFEEFSGLISANVTMFRIAANSSATFLFRYTPNDLTQDRTDAAFFRFQNGGRDWEIVLRATSVAPKLFVTPLVAFGPVEIGDTRRDTVIVENLSLVPLELTRLEMPDGFTILQQPRPFPTMLQPREQFRVVIQFAPTQDRRYDAAFRAVSQMPCATSIQGQFQGRGQIVRLDVSAQLVNFGFTRPCECRERVIPLQNPSFANPMTVRAITIDSTDVPGGTPQLFSWTSLRSPNGTVPYQIPANTLDTLRLRYCPRIPAEDRFATSQARLFIQAGGVGWEGTAEVFLAGRRTFVFKPSSARLAFTPTLINTDNATPQSVALTIPGVLQNPSPVPVVIDSISFSPNENIFRILAPTTFPIRLEPAQTLQVRVGFRPALPRLYEARLQMHQSQPCRDLDTTVFVSGIGFDNNAGLVMAMSARLNQGIDTLRITTCGTLSVPFFAFARNVAVAPRILRARILYDTTLIRITGISPELASIATMTSTRGGVEVRILTSRLDSALPLALLQMQSLSPRRAFMQFTIDSTKVFAPDGTESNLIANGYGIRMIIQQTSIDAVPPLPVRFDSVQVLDCRRQDLTIRNTGDVAVRAFSLVNLPPEVRVITSVPALTDSVRVGQMLRLTLEFCPRSERRIDTTLGVRSEIPCAAVTVATITGRGVLTDVPVQFSLTTASIGTGFGMLRGRITDTLTVPLVLNRDIAATLRNTTFWLRNFRFAVNIRYSPYSLKFIGATLAGSTKGRLTSMLNLSQSNSPQGALNLSFTEMDSLQAGTVALLRFVVPVPDTLISQIVVSPDSVSFRTDSLMFLRFRPQSSTTLFTTDGICDLTFLRFPKAGNVVAELRQNAPNPASDKTSIEFELAETSTVRLAIYSSQGMLMKSLLDGRQVLQAGRYAVDVATYDLAAGVYFYVLEGGGFAATRAMVIVR